MAGVLSSQRNRNVASLDKRLKRMSRVELLELMVNLSEDYEELSAENARLKRMVASQRLPRSAKVGSIAEAALRANGYFESVQRSADEYLREIKHLRDELAIQSGEAYQNNPRLAQAQAQAQTLIRDAQMRADQIVSRARSQAQAMLNDAQMRSDEAIALAERQASEIRSQATYQRGVPANQPRDIYGRPTYNASPDRTVQIPPQQQSYPAAGGRYL